MIAHSNNFKNAFTKLARQLDIIISYSGNAKLQTEDNKLILTQDNMQLITDQTSGEIDTELNGDEIYSLNKNNLGELFKTYMKSFDLETSHSFNVGEILNVKIGCLVDEDYEYLDYGNYIIYTKDYSEDRNTYTYTLCDYMLKTMIPFNLDYAFYEEEQDYTTVEDAIKSILRVCQLDVTDLDTTLLANKDGIIYKKSFENVNMSCRDVLDMIMQLTGCSLIANNDKALVKQINTTIVDELDEDIVNNTNATFNEKFGPLNSLLFSRSDEIDNIERKDDSSIAANGITQYVIKNNLILDQDNRADFIDELFNKIKGLEYYVCDFDTLGIGYIEYLDMFQVKAANIYKCLCLKNTGTINGGMSESFKSEEPEEKAQEYVSGGIDDKAAAIIMDKLKGTIVLKTDSDGKIAQVRLDSSGDEGSVVEISGDQIDLTGKQINLTSDDITIASTNFNVDKDGNMSCNNGTFSGAINGANINIDTTTFANGIVVKSTNANKSCTILGTGIYIRDNISSETASTSILYGTGTISTKGVVYAQSFEPTSKEELKKDFEPLKSGLAIIKDIDIYKYRFKEQEGNKKHIGFVIGDKYNYSKEITNNKNDGVDLYSFISVCCKAIQEQQEQIEELKKEIETLKGGNK